MKEVIECPCGGKYNRYTDSKGNPTATYYCNKSQQQHNHTIRHYRYLMQIKREQQEEARNLIQKQFGTAPSKL